MNRHQTAVLPTISAHKWELIPGCSSEYFWVAQLFYNVYWEPITLFDPSFFPQVDQMSNLRIHHMMVCFFRHENIFSCTQDSYENNLKSLLKSFPLYLRQCIMHKLYICQSLDFLQKIAINGAHNLQWVRINSQSFITTRIEMTFKNLLMKGSKI